MAAEEEGCDSGRQLLECKVGRGENGSTKMVGSVVQDLIEAGLNETKLQRAELSWQKADDSCSFWRRNEDTVDTVDDTISTKLVRLVFGI